MSLTEIFGHILLWALIIVCTCGFALFLFPYSFGSTLLNATHIVDQNGRIIGRLRCTANVGSYIGHALLWWLLSIVTLSIAGFFYAYRVGSDLFNMTVVEPPPA